MAYTLLFSSLTLLVLVSLIPTGESAIDPVTRAIRILSDSGYITMSLILQQASQTYKFPSSPFTIFAPPDSAFGYSGQPGFNLLQYHILPVKYSIQNLISLPYGTRIPTLFPNQSLLVSSYEKISLNGVTVNESPILDHRSLSIFAINDFFDPSYQITIGCHDRFHSAYEFDVEIAKVSALMLSRGYFIMSSSLNLQLRGLVKKSTPLTMFAVADSALAAYSMNLDLGSVFHRHFLPCKLTMEDLRGLENGTILRTLDKAFSIQVSKAGDLLLLNDVPFYVFVPDMYMSDSIVVHGVTQIIT